MSILDQSVCCDWSYFLVPICIFMCFHEKARNEARAAARGFERAVLEFEEAKRFSQETDKLLYALTVYQNGCIEQMRGSIDKLNSNVSSLDFFFFFEIPLLFRHYLNC